MCITFRCASVVKPLISMPKVVRAGNIVVLDEKDYAYSKYSRQHDDQAGREQQRCAQWTCGFASMKLVQFSVGRESKWPNRFRQACKAAELRRCEGADNRKLEKVEETALNGVEEGNTEYQMKEETELTAKKNWRRQTQKEREEHEATHVLLRDWCTHCMMGRGAPITTSQNEKK